MSSGAQRLLRGERRRALRLGLVNAGLWAAGNGLTTGPLVYYLADDLGAKPAELSLLLALPALVGLLRLFSPQVIRGAGSAKRACLRTTLASYVLILGLPVIGFLPQWFGKRDALVALIALICVHQLLEYVGTVALWSWLGDLVPQRIRGRYFARRNIVQLVVLIPTLTASGYFADFWRRQEWDVAHRLLGYSIPNAIGALCLLASLAPLALMPATPLRAAAQGDPISWRALLAPLLDARFRRLLLFQSWFSLANGISQYAQGIYPKRILGLGVGDLAVMSNTMRVGQIGVSAWAGPAIDRRGARTVLVICQVLVALAMVFYLIASPGSAWLLLGAYLLWSAYAGHNICLPALAIKLAPPDDRSPYLAARDALGSVFHTGATVAGGFFFQWLLDHTTTETAGPLAGLNPFMVVFAIGLAMRLLAVPLAAAINEKGE